jgi:hypothetical protein
MIPEGYKTGEEDQKELKIIPRVLAPAQGDK